MPSQTMTWTRSERLGRCYVLELELEERLKSIRATISALEEEERLEDAAQRRRAAATERAAKRRIAVEFAAVTGRPRPAAARPGPRRKSAAPPEQSA